MRFFHLSDLHIGKQLFRYHLVQEQADILRQIVEAAKMRKPDAILIAGDVYDKAVPMVEAVRMMDDFLTELSRIRPQIPVFLIAGNHDSKERLEFASRLLARQKIYISAIPPESQTEFLQKVTLTDEFGPVHFYLMPFIKPGHVRRWYGESVDTYDQAVRVLLEREQIEAAERNVLLTHQFYVNGNNLPGRTESETVTVGNIDSVDVSALWKFDYAAMGHIHRGQTVGEPRFRYCGSPYPYSVSEGEQQKGILEVTLKEKGSSPVVNEIPLKKLRDVRRFYGNLKDALALAGDGVCDDYMSLTLTDEQIPYELKETLQSHFPHLLQVQFDNAQTRAILEDTAADVDTTDPMEIFSGFFEELHGRKLNDTEASIVKEIINDAKEKNDR